MRDGTLTPDMPNHIVVGGRPYSVTTVAEVDDEGSLGRVQDPHLEIEILKDQHPLTRRDTLLHEVIHAIDHVTQIDLTEKQVYVLAGQLLDTLRRNPSFTEWLIS